MIIRGQDGVETLCGIDSVLGPQVHSQPHSGRGCPEWLVLLAEPSFITFESSFPAIPR